MIKFYYSLKQRTINSHYKKHEIYTPDGWKEYTEIIRSNNNSNFSDAELIYQTDKEPSKFDYRHK